MNNCLEEEHLVGSQQCTSTMRRAECVLVGAAALHGQTGEKIFLVNFH
jgi:hypothetical protein